MLTGQYSPIFFRPGQSIRVNKVNVVNVGEHEENAKFTSYVNENKVSGERSERCKEVFWVSRTLLAKAAKYTSRACSG